MPVTESIVRCLVTFGLLAAPFVILILISLWKERRGDWKRSGVTRGVIGGALALEAALDPGRRAAIEYILTDQGEVQEEDGEGEGVPPGTVIYTPADPHGSDEEDCFSFTSASRFVYTRSVKST